MDDAFKCILKIGWKCWSKTTPNNDLILCVLLPESGRFGIWGEGYRVDEVSVVFSLQSGSICVKIIDFPVEKVPAGCEIRRATRLSIVVSHRSVIHIKWQWWSVLTSTLYQIWQNRRSLRSHIKVHFRDDDSCAFFVHTKFPNISDPRIFSNHNSLL